MAMTGDGWAEVGRRRTGAGEAVAFHHPRGAIPLNDQPGRPARYYDRRLLIAITVVGMAAIVALPLSLAAPRSVTVLIFSTPVLLVLVSRMFELSWLLNAAVILFVVLLAAVLLPIAVLSVVAAFVLFVGPIVAVVVVGARLRDLDLVASGSFLLSGTIAVIAGFATAEMNGSALMILGVAAVGIVLVSTRIGRSAANA